ncbi:MAG: hypothetical protein N2D54_03110, partial [Chloroflexota bacterium]
IRIENVTLHHTGSTAFVNGLDWKVIAPTGAYTTTILNLAQQAKAAANRGSPYTNIANLVRDSEVTLQAFNMPPDKDFTVSMGPMGTRGINGFVIGNQTTGLGGNFIATYAIPAQLRGSEMIAIRLQSTSSEHFTYDFFQNVDGYNATSGAAVFNGDWLLPAGTYPSTLINSVDPEVSVTLSGFNFTKNDVYNVRMGPLGTQGVGGIIVGAQATDGLGTFSSTFTIPPALVGAPNIAIRFESQNTAYFAYDWFWNLAP